MGGGWLGFSSLDSKSRILDSGFIFFLQKSVLPSKNQFFYPGNIFLKILIFYEKNVICLVINPHLLGDLLF